MAAIVVVTELHFGQDVVENRAQFRLGRLLADSVWIVNGNVYFFWY